MNLFKEVHEKQDVPNTSELPQMKAHVEKGEDWQNAIELPDDVGGWQDSVAIPDERGEWQDHIKLDSGDIADYHNNVGIENDAPNETRELTDVEREWLKNSLGWNDNQISKCTIGENNVIHYRTDRCDLEGKTSENGVPYVRKQVEIAGIKIEGVFPKFESVYTTELPPDKLKSNTYAKECNARLKEAITNDPWLRKCFTEEQIRDIESNKTPTGYVWHHNEVPGKMELVKRSDHDRAIGGAAHTGGSALWGPDSVSKAEKGETF